MIVRLLLASCFCFVVGAVVRWDTADYRRFLAQIRMAWTMAGITAKQRCAAMRLDKGQMSRIESGSERLHADRLALLMSEYPSFAGFLAVVLVKDYGLPEEARAAARLAQRMSA